MLKALLRHIYRQPKVVRSQYAFFMAAGLTLLVTMIWLPTVFVKQSLQVGGGMAQVGGSEVLSGLMDQAKDQFDQEIGATTSATSNPGPVGGAGQIILSPEDVAVAQMKLREATTTKPVLIKTESQGNQEIQVITTSQAALRATATATGTKPQ